MVSRVLMIPRTVRIVVARESPLSLALTLFILRLLVAPHRAPSLSRNEQNQYRCTSMRAYPRRETPNRSKRRVLTEAPPPRRLNEGLKRLLRTLGWQGRRWRDGRRDGSGSR